MFVLCLMFIFCSLLEPFIFLVSRIKWGSISRTISSISSPFLKLSAEFAIKLNPRYPDAHHNLANIYRAQGKNEESIELYLRAIELNPALWQSHQNLGAIYYDLGEFDKSIEHNLKSIEINPQNLNGYLNLGVLYLQTGDKTKAEKYFSRVLHFDPENQMAQQGLLELKK